jgi:hypothetical protein
MRRLGATEKGRNCFDGRRQAARGGQAPEAAAADPWGPLSPLPRIATALVQ